MLEFYQKLVQENDWFQKWPKFISIISEVCGNYNLVCPIAVNVMCQYACNFVYYFYFGSLFIKQMLFLNIGFL
jgi:hypothetical protein